MKFRPCIDLLNGRVVQIVGGTIDEAGGAGPQMNFESGKSPEFYAQLYQRNGFTGGHVIALGKGNREAALSALRAYPGGLHMGGGITPETAGEFLDAGASHVIVTSYVFSDGVMNQDRLRAMVDAVGKKRLVLDLSCRRRGDDFWVVTDRWQKFTDLRVTPEVLHQFAEHCDEFLVHAVDVEGKMGGVQAEIVEICSHSPIPVTYAGGARSLGDLDAVQAIGRGRVDLTIGSALDIFGGKVAYADVVAWSQRMKNG